MGWFFSWSNPTTVEVCFPDGCWTMKEYSKNPDYPLFMTEIMLSLIRKGKRFFINWKTCSKIGSSSRSFFMLFVFIVSSPYSFTSFFSYTGFSSFTRHSSNTVEKGVFTLDSTTYLFRKPLLSGSESSYNMGLTT